MSTNHRPQLESKRGKVIRIKDSIRHARGLPQQKSLKYRQDIPSAVGDYESDEGSDDEDKEKEETVSEPALKKAKVEASTIREVVTKVAEKPEEEDAPSESESESESDSDDETAALLEELEKIRQEKDKQDDQEEQSKSLAVQQEPSTKKKSWRLSTAFNNKANPQTDKDKRYSTDVLDSEYHQKLMSKYIR
ncbi:Pre-mRNA-splicing factor CWC15 [Candida viswanathii]|uniref:Pre-mRNA-splicing factor CWC15 n=1 Tax=Candida viswanathii TaxID=5486 RepID=A0A367YDV0_9ASCO|nr:Pre-mRNA-splicing factor CWC15 [Candida viswanathii]